MLKCYAQEKHRGGAGTMAKSGLPSRVGHQPLRDATRRRLVAAAIEALREDGYAGASARTIARRAGCNQGLVFYHFASVANLLLAALDETSRVRLEHYREALAAASDPAGLVVIATRIYREDIDAGHLTVLTQMIAGASSTPGLGAEVAARIEPWIELTETTLRRVLGRPLGALIDPREAAYAVVALVLGVEILGHLDPDPTRAESLLAAAGELSKVLTMLVPRPGSRTRPA
jgi:AcrR family transcriptional regulator